MRAKPSLQAPSHMSQAHLSSDSICHRQENTIHRARSSTSQHCQDFNRPPADIYNRVRWHSSSPNMGTRLHIHKVYRNADISTMLLRKTEIVGGIQQLKNGKAAGHDNLDAELFKEHPSSQQKFSLHSLSSGGKCQYHTRKLRKGINIKIAK